MPIETTCTSCGRPLRVPDELMGRQVKCPNCRTTFTASARDGGVAPPQMPVEPYVEEPLGRDDDEEFPPRRGREHAAARDAVNGPATALMIVGIIGCVLVPLGMAWNVYLMVAGEQANPFRPAARNPGAGPDPEFLEDLDMLSGPLGLVQGVAGLAISIVMIMGAVKMKRLESYGLAMTASILGMIPCISPCCLLGLPFGIWSITVLNRPEIKDSFH